MARTGDGEDGISYTLVRNAFLGIVTGVKLGDVVAQVEVQVGPHRLVSLLTREAVDELGLAVGMEATARVKSTNVHTARRGLVGRHLAWRLRRPRPVAHPGQLGRPGRGNRFGSGQA